MSSLHRFPHNVPLSSQRPIPACIGLKAKSVMSSPGKVLLRLFWIADQERRGHVLKTWQHGLHKILGRKSKTLGKPTSSNHIGGCDRRMYEDKEMPAKQFDWQTSKHINTIAGTRIHCWMVRWSRKRTHCGPRANKFGVPGKLVFCIVNILLVFVPKNVLKEAGHVDQLFAQVFCSKAMSFTVHLQYGWWCQGWPKVA